MDSGATQLFAYFGASPGPIRKFIQANPHSLGQKSELIVRKSLPLSDEIRQLFGQIFILENSVAAPLAFADEYPSQDSPEVQGTKAIMDELSQLCRRLAAGQDPALRNALFVEPYPSELTDMIYDAVRYYRFFGSLTVPGGSRIATLIRSGERNVAEQAFETFFQGSTTQTRFQYPRSRLFRSAARRTVDALRLKSVPVRTLPSEKPALFFVTDSRTDVFSETLLPVMNEVASLGYLPVGVCLGIDENYREMAKAPHPIESIDYHVSLADIAQALSLTLRTYRNWWKLKPAYYREAQGKLRAQGAGIIPLIDPQLDLLFSWTCFRRLTRWYAIQKLLKKYRPVAIKAGTEGNELNCLFHQEVAIERPLMVQFHHADVRYFAFASYSKVDLFLMNGEAVRDRWALSGVDPKKMIITGMARFDKITQFKASHSRQDSAAALGISRPTRKFVIAGFLTDREGPDRNEHREFLTQLCRLARKLDAFIIVKLHPNETNVAFIENLVREIGPEVQFKVLGGSKTTPHILNYADACIVDRFSSVTFEAVLFGKDKVIVSSNEPHEKAAEFFHGAILNVHTYDELEKGLTSLIGDEAFRKQMIEKQRAAIIKARHALDGQSARRIAQAIDEALHSRGKGPTKREEI
ncbi:MAG: hypothetical protein AB7P04_15345 [Bacteriovoracia bacterium]